MVKSLGSGIREIIQILATYELGVLGDLFKKSQYLLNMF